MCCSWLCTMPQNLHYLKNCYPEGCAAPGFVPCQCNTWGSLSKLKRAPPQRKINVTCKSPVGDISVVTLIRTDTTLDHSQKAEKVWCTLERSQHPKFQQFFNVPKNWWPKSWATVPQPWGRAGHTYTYLYAYVYIHASTIKYLYIITRVYESELCAYIYVCMYT